MFLPWAIPMIPPDVRAVFFDAVGTLIHPEPAAAAVYAAVARSLGSRLTEPEIAIRFRTAFAHEEAFDLANGLRTSEERERRRWRNIVAEVLHDVGDGERRFLSCSPISPARTPGAATRRRGRCSGNWSGAVASWGWRRTTTAACAPWRPDCPRCGRYGTSSSARRSAAKPAPQFFAALCERTGLGPREILFVGDDRVNDRDGATAAGLQAVLVGDEGIGELRKLML